MAGTGEGGADRKIVSPREAIAWQAELLERSGSPGTARVVRGEVAILDTDTVTGLRMARWANLTLRDAMPLRVAAGLHHLLLTGEDARLAPVYQGLVTDQPAIDALVAELATTYDTRLLPWLDHPPQTNEAGRSASIMAGLKWLAAVVAPRFDLVEIGASAGVNTMMGRYFYDLGGVKAGPGLSRMRIVPEWRGPPPPNLPVEIVASRGCDIRPVDLADPAEALSLKAYVWPDARERMARLEAAIALATLAPPELVRADAAAFLHERLAAPQEEGVTRALFHSNLWQYLPEAARTEITTMMEETGRRASRGRPLAWLAAETNRATFRHELTVRFWPGGSAPVLLAEAHPHGSWIEWLGVEPPLRGK